MRSERGLIHQVSFCAKCGKRWEDYINERSRKAAYTHAKNTGHTVTVESGTFITYNP